MTSEDIEALRTKRYNATVIRLDLANPELMKIRIRPDRSLPPHKPGQYCTLGMGYWEPRLPDCQEEILTPGDETKLARRAYSISNPILDDNGRLLDLTQTDWLEFYIVLVRKSNKAQAPALTPRLFTAGQGTRLFMGEKITGHFTLDPVQPSDAVLFLSTGTGEAPHNYMLWDLLRRGHSGRIFAACCVRYQRDLAYLATHQELMQRFPNYSFMGLTTRENLQTGRKVYIQDLITSGQLEAHLGLPLNPEKMHVFLCGNPNMIGVPNKDPETGERIFPSPPGVIEILEKRGFQVDQPNIKLKGNIHFEEYW
jgi:ferredoxin--NADP+ reductase